MDRFQAMQVFTRVVEANSFSLAAESLGLPRATVTTTIQGLERLLQVRLLNRTTRRISLTPDGAAYYDRCKGVLAEVEDIEASFREITGGPKGRLRIDVPPSIGRLALIPALCNFHHRYPDIELAIGMADRPVDLVREGVDCAIRVGELKDSSMVARRIGTFDSLTCASPDYLARHGEPQTVADLCNHTAVHYFSNRSGRTVDWELIVDGVPTVVKPPGTVSVNDADAYLACGLLGFGLVHAARYMALPYLQSGQLREVLAHAPSVPMPISVVYPHSRHLSAKVRVFVDWVADLFEHCPLFSGQGAAGANACSFVNPMSDNTIRSVVEQNNLAESLF